MYTRLLVFTTKFLIRLLRLTGHSGSALPGLIIERIHPSFLEKSLQSVEKQVVVVTGTNGKTTTTKMLVSVLRGAGKTVVTNGTGSNMTRGLISALVDDMTYLGSLKPTDWFVFEMDEAYAPIFTRSIHPYMVVGLNVLRDQLDRYGELDTTAKLIGQSARQADVFVYNQIDPLLRAVADGLPKKQTTSFGVASSLMKRVMNEQTIHGVGTQKVQPSPADIVLFEATDQDGALSTTVGGSEGEQYQLRVPLMGFHNALNVTAVWAALSKIDDVSPDQVTEALATMPTPFGRGERLVYKKTNITVALVKNPSGFTSNLETFVTNSSPEVVLFVVNDNIADGRDVSWLWDVQFKGVIPKSTKIYTSGIRGCDMALRLKQDGYASEIDLSVGNCITKLLDLGVGSICIIPTYTALFEVRSVLAKHMEVPKIW